ncbi:MAG: hypothetical protein VX910_00230 [Candidatus Latescibacterota bacterium]|jgi:hypothetical protein|nr:hypothetical protein [Candidatus Latescibacterota bacterium]
MSFLLDKPIRSCHCGRLFCSCLGDQGVSELVTLLVFVLEDDVVCEILFVVLVLRGLNKASIEDATFPSTSLLLEYAKPPVHNVKVTLGDVK